MPRDHRRCWSASGHRRRWRTPETDLHLVWSPWWSHRVDGLRSDRAGTDEKRPVVVNEGDGQLPARQRCRQAQDTAEAHRETRHEGLIFYTRRGRAPPLWRTVLRTDGENFVGSVQPGLSEV